MSRRQDIKLKYIAVFLWILALGNTIDLFFEPYKVLKSIKGKVSSIKNESITKNKYIRYRKTIVCDKITIGMEGFGRVFFVIEETSSDSLLLRLKQGDEIHLYAKRWYHFFSYFGLDANFFLVKKDGKTIYDITYKCKKSNRIFVAVYGLSALLFTLMYFDQAKNISIANWYKKRFRKKKRDIT